MVSSLLASLASVVAINGWFGLMKLLGAVKGLMLTIVASPLTSYLVLLKEQIVHVGVGSFAILALSLATMTVVDDGASPPEEVELLVQSALSRQGYTKELAQKLERESGDRYFETEYYTARLPVSFAQADDGGLCHGPGKVGQEDLADANFGEGVRYDGKRNNEVIATWMAALAPCASEDKPVRLRVEGYASSRPFDGCTKQESRLLNVEVANRRAQTVVRALEEGLREPGWAEKEEWFRVEPVSFSDLREMERAREFNDRPPSTSALAGAARSQDFFSLAAHIKLLSAGECAFE